MCNDLKWEKQCSEVVKKILGMIKRNFKPELNVC